MAAALVLPPKRSNSQVSTAELGVATASSPWPWPRAATWADGRYQIGPVPPRQARRSSINSRN